MEEKAAKIFEYYAFNHNERNRMVADMNELYPNEYSRPQRRQFFDKYLADPQLLQRVKDFIDVSREKIIADTHPDIRKYLAGIDLNVEVENSDENIVVKKYFYELFPRFTLDEVEDRISLIVDFVDFYNEEDDNMVHAVMKAAEMVAEYFEFDIDMHRSDMVDNLIEVVQDHGMYGYEFDDERIAEYAMESVCHDKAKILEKIRKKEEEYSRDMWEEDVKRKIDGTEYDSTGDLIKKMFYFFYIEGLTLKCIEDIVYAHIGDESSETSE